MQSKLQQQIAKSEELVREQSKQIDELRSVTNSIQVKVETKPEAESK